MGYSEIARPVTPSRELYLMYWLHLRNIVGLVVVEDKTPSGSAA